MTSHTIDTHSVGVGSITIKPAAMMPRVKPMVMTTLKAGEVAARIGDFLLSMRGIGESSTQTPSRDTHTHTVTCKAVGVEY